jgi:hypothetical protein
MRQCNKNVAGKFRHKLPTSLMMNILLTAGEDMSEPLLRPDDAKHARLKQLLADLEIELQQIPADSLYAASLKRDFAALKLHLELPEANPGILREQIGRTRHSAQELMDTVEGEILKDSPYIAELGRILGMI